MTTLLAPTKRLSKFKTLTFTGVNIYSDSQSAIAAILNSKSNPKAVQQFWIKLNKLDKLYKWSLSCWTKRQRTSR
jgi:hypothetical protein